MENSNAQAGPSSSSALYLVPKPTSPGPSAPPTPRQHLASTQDLLTRFRLLPAYDKYVRPFATQYSHDGLVSPDKGKAREQDSALPCPPPADGPEHDDDDGAAGPKAEKKKKNNYKALIKGIPGKHSMKKDDYLTQTMLAPEKQRTHIHHFDLRTQQDAFAVSLEGLKGWNVTTLIVESAQAREDRKKRKELKRLAKAQQAQAAAAMQAVAGLTSPTVVQPQPLLAHRGASAAPQISSSISSTPKPVPSIVPRPASTVPRPGSTAPRPSSTAPRPLSAAPILNIKQEPVPPAMVATPTGSSSESLRGKKREREDATMPLNGVPPPTDSAYTNGVVNGNGMSKLNAKAGVIGVRPRPVKKQRMDVQGQARDVSAPVQQPTPQGV